MSASRASSICSIKRLTRSPCLISQLFSTIGWKILNSKLSTQQRNILFVQQCSLRFTSTPSYNTYLPNSLCLDSMLRPSFIISTYTIITNKHMYTGKSGRVRAQWHLYTRYNINTVVFLRLHPEYEDHECPISEEGNHGKKDKNLSHNTTSGCSLLTICGCFSDKFTRMEAFRGILNESATFFKIFGKQKCRGDTMLRQGAKKQQQEQS